MPRSSTLAAHAPPRTDCASGSRHGGGTRGPSLPPESPRYWGLTSGGWPRPGPRVTEARPAPDSYGCRATILSWCIWPPSLLDLELHGLKYRAVLHDVAAPIAGRVGAEGLRAVSTPGRAADLELHACELSIALVPHVLNAARAVSAGDLAVAVQLLGTLRERRRRAAECAIGDRGADGRFRRHGRGGGGARLSWILCARDHWREHDGRGEYGG